MADWLDPVFLATIALVLATAVLVWVTWTLATHTRNLVGSTDRLAQSSERLEKQQADQFAKEGPLMHVAFPSLAGWQYLPDNPGKPHLAKFRFWVRNEGRQSGIVAGAVIRWAQASGKPQEWPLTITKGLPQTVDPLGMVGPIEGDVILWPEDIEELVRDKKAILYAFTPAGTTIREGEVRIWPSEPVEGKAQAAQLPA